MQKNQFKEIKDSLPSVVNLLAVSKGHPASSIKSLASFGQLDFGESRVQEALPKIDDLKDETDIKWHFIGRLQKNKVRAVVNSFKVIHSVDSLSLAERINRIAGEENKRPEVLFQVKFLEDSAKTGFHPDELNLVWPKLMSLQNLKSIGLMTIPPLQSCMEKRKRVFTDCRRCADELGLTHCSMGMSNDWPEAVKAGSTWIRLGAVLFGERP